MTATTSQFDLVHDSLPLVAGRLDQAATVFEGTLLRIAPSWGAGAAAGGPNATALLHLICAGLTGTSKAEDIAVQLGEMAARLAATGLRPQGYVAIHAALMAMITQQVAPTPAAQDAWEEVIGTILSSMVAAAYGPRRATLPLAA